MKQLFSVAFMFVAVAGPAFGIAGVDTVPAPSAPRETAFTQPKETKLANGLRVIVIERPKLPLLAAELLIRNGAEIDPKDLAGAPGMTGPLLTQRTESIMGAPSRAAI